MAKAILPVRLSPTAMDIRAALKEAMHRLRAADVPSHTLAAELLLMHTLERDRAWLYTHSEAALDSAATQKYFALIARRAAGEPTQYLTGKQEFWGLEFEVTPAVLIPRPETEHVVEVALERLGSRGIKINLATGAPSPLLRIADVGAGSGCLAVALAHELPHAEIVATDISAAALEVARRNAARHGVAGRIRFLECNLLDGLVRDPSSAVGARHAVPLQEAGGGDATPLPEAAGRDSGRHEAGWHDTKQHGDADRQCFDLIVSNPPYVGRNQTAQLPREVRDHEPHTALFGGATGVEIYGRLIEQSGALLRDGGILVLELGYNSAEHVRGILASQAQWSDLKITNDLAGIPRVIAAQNNWPPPTQSSS